MTAKIRLATQLDAEQILEIYAPIVRHTSISFEIEPPTITEMQHRLVTTLELFPWLVCEQEGKVLGYTYAGKHRLRAAYQWSVDVGIYVLPQVQRTGIGRALYGSLFTILRMQGYYQVFAGIALPNPGSVGLHKTFGFTLIGIYRNVGYKLGAWRNVGWWQLSLQSPPEVPDPPKDMQTAQKLPGWRIALATGEKMLVDN